MNLKIKLTTAGIAALVNPANVGTNALQIATIKLGSANYNPTGNESDLQSPIKTLNTFGGDVVANDTLHVTVRDDSNDTYNLGEIGLYSGTGVLMGIVSSAGVTMTEKGINDILLFSADLSFTDSDVSNITFGETSFIYQPGTEQAAGIFELATHAEVDAKTANKVIDAAKFHGGIDRRSSSSTNLNDANKIATAAAVYALSQSIAANNTAINNINTLLNSDRSDLNSLQEVVDFIEAIKGTQDTLAISNISGLQSALDGKTSNGHGHAISSITNLQTTLNGKAPTSHNHAISNITNLQTTLNGKAPTSHGHAIGDITNLQNTLNGKAASNHGHAISAITGLQTALNGKADDSHHHDGAYSKIGKNNSVGDLVFGHVDNSSITIPYGTDIDLTATGRKIYPAGLTSDAITFDYINVITSGRWQCLGDGKNGKFTLWQRVA